MLAEIEPSSKRGSGGVEIETGPSLTSLKAGVLLLPIDSLLVLVSPLTRLPLQRFILDHVHRLILTQPVSNHAPANQGLGEGLPVRWTEPFFAW